MRGTGPLGALLAGGAMVGAVAAGGQPPRKPADTALFDRAVLPILKANCLACHAGASASGKLDLTSRAALLRGGASGPAVDFAHPERSLLIRAVRHDGRQMPPQGKLAPDKIDTLTRWVRLGAPYSESAAAVPVRKGPPPVNEENRRFWSFQPVAPQKAPAVKRAAWVRNPIDAFLLAKLEGKGLSPAPPADRPALLRRLYYDLVGLPPTPEEVRSFVADARPDAYEKRVDALLASPQYGEKWGRHWLDLVRYAETNSYERDGDKPFVWRYRDWVIRALNADKPYDRFLTEQLAGDELPDADAQTLIATGYYRLGQWDDEPVDGLQAKYDELDDLLTTTGQTMLGLTVNCARCHDHKIDPIPQKDYYRLLAFFNNINPYGNRSHESVVANSLKPISPEAEKQRFARENAAWTARLETCDTRLAEIERKVRPTFQQVEREEFRDEFKRPGILLKRVPAVISNAEYDEYVKVAKERQELRENPPKSLEMALCVSEPGARWPETHVLARGNSAAPGDEVTPGVPSILSRLEVPLDEPTPGAPTAGLRLQLAHWIANPANPLTGRVIVNRVWQYHFGRGIVRSSSNFGFMGTPPTHHELLDWLADRFVTPEAQGGLGWKLKSLHRLMVTSSAYRMSSRPSAAALKQDPENDLYARFDMRRLQAEEIRDSILKVSGTLSLKQFGPSIFAPIPDEVLAGQSVPGAGWGKSDPEDASRRSIYVKVKRSLVVPIFASFDGADTDLTCPVRNATVVPTQALSLLNSAFVGEQASLFARRVKAAAGSDPTAQVKWALWQVLQRAPTEKEVKRGVELMRGLREKEGYDADRALGAFCLVALNLNEFLYLD